ncbi:MAG: 50S ribosomal protein L25/general stress protein Ctc [Holosporales bacterium]|jgi:large subunit ribosomal protein L25|nr:50S ribosomal protein L25/general stress protein Ctc [Holosporales bacterium]
MATSLKIAERSAHGKRAARKLRHDGFVPGVIYGGDRGPVLVEIAAKELKIECESAAFFGHAIEMKLESIIEKFIPKQVDLHPVTGIPIHVDFQRITKDSRVKVSISIEFTNEDKAPGIKKGGVINFIVHRLECYCSPESIPERLLVDLTGKEIGDSILLMEIALPDGVAPVHQERDSVIATIAGARVSSGDEDDSATTEDAAEGSTE